MASFQAVLSSLFSGFSINLTIFVCTLLIAIPLGLIITFGSMASFWPIRYLARAFVWVIRGTPLMLQIIVVFYGPGLLWDMPMTSRLTAVLFAFAINYAAYFSEIYRGGIESIPKGQYEAGYALGMTKTQVFFKIVLFQVVKRIVAPMSNEIITLVKDTSLARVVSVAEIIMCAERFTRQGLIWPLFSTGLYFLLFNGALTLLFSYVEKKLDYYHG